METQRRLTLYNERKEKIKEWAKAMYPNEEQCLKLYKALKTTLELENLI